MSEPGQEITQVRAAVSIEPLLAVTPSQSPSSSEVTTTKKKVVSILSHSIVDDHDEKNGTENIARETEYENKSSSRSRAYRLRVEWNDKSQSVETIARVVDEDLLLVIQYLNKHKLMVRYGTFSSPSPCCWVDHLPEHVRRQVPVVLRPDPDDDDFQSNLLHLSVVHRALRLGLGSFDKKPHATDDSYRELREGVYELFVADAAAGEYATDTADADGSADAGSNSDAEGSADAGGSEYEGSAGATGAIAGEASAGTTAVRRHKGAQRYKRCMLKLKRQLQLCFSKQTKRLEMHSIRALKEFATETARPDPALVEMKSSANAREFSRSEEKEKVVLSSDRKAREPDGKADGNSDATGYVFGSFSCLVNRPNTPAQFRHVDAHAYERQYTMAIGGSGSRPTVSCVVVDPMRTPNDVMKVWTELVRDSCASSKNSHGSAARSSLCGLDDESTLQHVAASILETMKENDQIVDWIANYGKVLARPCRTVDVTELEWEPGTVVSLHGGNVHYGPSNEDFRSILFFTASPSGSAPYDVDLQFAGPTLAATIAFQLWDHHVAATQCSLHHAEFLERVLHRCVLEDPSCTDFEAYLSPAIPTDHPIRLAMRRAHEKKEKAVVSRSATSSVALSRSIPGPPPCPSTADPTKGPTGEEDANPAKKKVRVA